MGADFLRKQANAFSKSLNQARVDLSTPDLLTHGPDEQPRAYPAEMKTDTKFTLGECLIVCFEGEKVVARRGTRTVAEFTSLPKRLTKALAEESYGTACGIVNQVYELAGKLDIAIC